MAGRLALVIGSQNQNLPELPFVDDLAQSLQDALAAGHWRPVNGDWLRNPTTAELEDAVEEAFTAADEATATLLIAFIGHGVARGSQNFYLMGYDANPEKAKSKNAFHFTQFIQEQLIDYPGLDGLVFLIDACQAWEGVEGAATRWTEVLADNKGRLELLVASGRRSAYNGCFTRTILETFRTGLATRGDALLCADLVPEISRCVGQRLYLAFSGATLISGDPGLWLVPNVARSRDAVTGRPAAGLVDQLTAGVIATASVRGKLAAIEDAGSERLRLVVGAAGSGKSTLLALFIRPKVAKTLDIADDYIKAAAFLDGTSTLESLAAELSAQLTVTLPGYREALEAVAAGDTGANPATLSSWDTAVRLPLTRCAESGRVHLIVDGLDQTQPGARELILGALQHMTATAPSAELGHVRVIAGVRSRQNVDSRTELRHAHRIEVAAPTLSELVRATSTAAGKEISENLLSASVGDGASGGWLIARLIREIADSTTELAEFDNLAALVAARVRHAEAGANAWESRNGLLALSVIAAAGYGPLLPIRLLAATLVGPDSVPALSRIRNTVVKFGALISRGKPGTEQETVGISHHALLGTVNDYLQTRGLDPGDAHRPIIDACERLDGEDVHAYWSTAAPRHYLGVNDPEAVIEFLEKHATARAADNRDRWASWMPAITAKLGAENPDTFRVRRILADYQGEAGDPTGAVAELRHVVDSAGQVLGADHREVLTCRQSLARWQGDAGDLSGAAAATKLLSADLTRVLGADDPATLINRREHAFWRGTGGDAKGAAEEMEELLPDVLRVRGPSHPDTLTAEFMVAYWRGEAGDARGAITLLEKVVADQIRVIGPNHPNTFGARGTLAYWRGDAGDPARAAADTQQLLADRTRVLGPNHPRTLATRHNLALWQGESGNRREAVAALTDLIPDERRILGADSTYTLRTRNLLAILRGEGGDATGAAADTRQLLDDCLPVLGPDHPDTLAVQHALAIWEREAADPATAESRPDLGPWRRRTTL
jgi:Tetratricopeptide repeat